MDRLILVACCLTAVTMWPLLAKAELDLADLAGVWVSSMRGGLLGVDDRWEGPASLHDNDPATAFLPPVGEPFEIQLRLRSSTGDAVQLQRLVITGLDRAVAPASIEFGGMVLQVDDLVATTEGAETRINLTATGAGTLLRLNFAPLTTDAGITDISAFAVGPAPTGSPGLNLTPWLGGLAVGATPVPGASHMEISRRQDGREFRFTLNPGVHQSWDRPAPGPVEYRGRAIGFDGSAAEWGEPETLEFAPPPNSPGLFGVVEGFYGRPWTWTERLGALRLMAALGMNAYVYAPKDDPLHRKEWTSPYPDREMRWFSRLLQVGQAVGVEVVYAISPGLTIKPYSDRDFERLTAKLEPFVAAGCRSFALCLDDIKVKTDARSGRAHAALTTRLNRWLEERESKLMMVGTVYFATSRTKAALRIEYLKELSWIPPEVPIMWTGEGVFDAVMDPNHAAGVGREFLRRKPLVWDNYPVNDYFYRSRRLFLGPVTGRGEELLEQISGLLVNPMTHQVASRPAMLSYARLFASPGDYTPEYLPDELMLVLEAVGDPSPYELLVHDYARSPKLHPEAPAHPELETLVGLFLKAAGRKGGDGCKPAAERLAAALAERYTGDARVLAGARNPSLADELWPVLHKRRAQLELALAVVGALASPGDAGAAAALEVLWAEHVPRPLGWRWYALDDALDPLLERVPALLERATPAGTGAPLLTLPADVHQGDTVDVGPGEGAEFTAVFGVGALLADGRLRWTPAIPGYARLVVVQRGEGFWRPTCWRPFVHEAPAPIAE